MRMDARTGDHSDPESLLEGDSQDHARASSGDESGGETPGLITVKMTKKDKKHVAPEKKMLHHVGEDPAKLIAELNPGKKGGDYELPFGGQICIPAGIFGKKDVVTCCMMSPSDRYKYLPPLRSDEHLLSEVFLLATSVKNVKKELWLRLPYKQENTELFDIELLWKRVEGDEWAKKDFTFSKKGRYAELSTNSGGIFVVISRPKMETFEIPVQGCLYNSRLSHQISVRFPKKATAIDLIGDIVISPVNRDNMPNLTKDFPHDMADLLSLSDYVTIRTNIPTQFKRAVTVKLPLPPLENEEFPEEDMVVMVHNGGEWLLLDQQLKFTKSSVMFDVKEFSKYCVALCAPQRKRRLVNAFRHLNEEESVIRGHVIPFIHIQEKLWTMFVEVVPLHAVESCVRKRESEGFRRVKQVEIPKEVKEVPNFRGRNWRNKNIPVEEPKPEREDLDLMSGHLFDFDITGDVLMTSDENSITHLGLHFHDRLEENYRKVFVEPRLVKDFKTLVGSLKIYKPTSDDDSNKNTKRESLRMFDIEVSGEEVDAFFYEPPPTPEPEPEPVPIIEESREATPAPPPTTATSRPPTASFLRLITPMKPPRIVVKESKVLTGRSLMCLAREIEQGLTLAIHLDISDSCITGLGFDALANGLSLADITYRILLLWKRRTSKLKDAQVQLLTGALQEMGRNDVATIVAEQHRKNKELTSECFEMPRYGDELISAVA